MACTLFVVYASQIMSFPSCDADTRCLRSVDQCMAYILARCPFRSFRAFMPMRGKGSVWFWATPRTVITQISFHPLSLRRSLGALELYSIKRPFATYERYLPTHPSCALSCPSGPPHHVVRLRFWPASAPQTFRQTLRRSRCSYSGRSLRDIKTQCLGVVVLLV